jgi:hypothetical protein
MAAEHAYRYSGSVKDNKEHGKGKHIFCDDIILQCEHVQDKVKTLSDKVGTTKTLSNKVGQGFPVSLFGWCCLTCSFSILVAATKVSEFRSKSSKDSSVIVRSAVCTSEVGISRKENPKNVRTYLFPTVLVPW